MECKISVSKFDFDKCTVADWIINRILLGEAYEIKEYFTCGGKIERLLEKVDESIHLLWIKMVSGDNILSPLTYFKDCPYS